MKDADITAASRPAAETLSNVIDDIRHKVVEQPWSGEQQTGNLHDFGGEKEALMAQPQEQGKEETKTIWDGLENPNDPENDQAQENDIER